MNPAQRYEIDALEEEKTRMLKMFADLAADPLAFDLWRDVSDSHLSATQALSLCLHQSSG
ncbi:MAG TPA: hypothetical protein VJ248_06355 [Candidatus Udaeobacter sp.]|nr:hypothetical protein [Candidatus Udaeobacter sp.]